LKKSFSLFWGNNKPDVKTICFDVSLFLDSCGCWASGQWAYACR